MIQLLPGPTWVAQHERSIPAAPVHVDDRYLMARLLVTDRGRPAGLVDVRLVDGQATAAAVTAAAAVLPVAPPSPQPGHAAPLTVVIPTRGRTGSLLRCIDAVLDGTYRAVTVLVVDNTPSDTDTELAVKALDDPRVAWVREDRRGKSAACNLGLRAARTELVAFLDDDTVPDARWAARIVRGFTDPNTMCVTGLVLAARLDTVEERASDHMLGWAKGFTPRAFHIDTPPAGSRIFPFAPGVVGIGANLAVRRTAALLIGGFDQTLGPGTPACGGEDCEFLVRVLLRGHRIHYVPGAFVWHHHRVDADGYAEQLTGYRRGLGGFLAKIAVDAGSRRVALRRLPAAIAHLGQVVAPDTPAGVPTQPAARKVLDVVAGAAAHLAARPAARRAGHRSPPMTWSWPVPVTHRNP